MYNQETTGLFYDQDASYGTTYAYKGFFGAFCLLTTDLTAVAYILSHSDSIRNQTSSAITSQRWGREIKAFSPQKAVYTEDG